MTRCLSASGGLAGAAIGGSVTVAVARGHGWAPAITPASIWGGIAVAVAVGAVAGCYPALRAARLSPTDALRST
jgi:putative ABC transport system permease protein